MRLFRIAVAKELVSTTALLVLRHAQPGTQMPGPACAARPAWLTTIPHCRYGGVDLWVWNTGKPLLQRPMPPFIFGRSRYDNWLTHELAQEGARRVVDATTAMMPVHVRHNYAHLANASSGTAPCAAATMLLRPMLIAVVSLLACWADTAFTTPQSKHVHAQHGPTSTC